MGVPTAMPHFRPERLDLSIYGHIVCDMSTCLSFDEILELRSPQVAELQRVGGLYVGQDTPEACRVFTKQVKLVEGAVTSAYADAAQITRKTECPEEISKIWSAMNDYCDKALQVISGLKDKYPFCGTPELYSLLLDYKLACDKRCRNILEEIECLKTPPPKGLFPEQI